MFDLNKVLSQKINNTKKATDKRHANTIKYLESGFSNIKGTEFKITDNVVLNALNDALQNIESETYKYEFAKSCDNFQKRIIREHNKQ